LEAFAKEEADKRTLNNPRERGKEKRKNEERAEERKSFW
jgi:hypothetical protein